MAKTRRLFISDIHLGGNESASWFQKHLHEPRLIAFLDWVAAQTDVKDLVLLGDLFDTWMFPMDEAPAPLVPLIQQRHPEVVKGVVRARAAVENIFYVNGNHDLTVTQRDLDALFGPGVVQQIPQYNAGLLYAEHGSRFAMFNARDKLHDPTHGLPLGYFITRLLAGSRCEYTSPRAVIGYVDDVLESLFTTQTLAASVIEALAELTGRAPTDVFLMPDGRPALTVAQVQQKYSALYQRWQERFGPRYAVQSIIAEGSSLEWFADRLMRQNGYKVVVLGHTHHADLDADGGPLKAKVGDRAYANSGYFCPQGPNDRATFVEVDKTPQGLCAKVWDITTGAPTEVDAVQVV